jgi:hypothetical protein
MDVADIRNRFTYHPPKGDQSDRYDAIRQSMLALALALNDLVPDSREKSLAITSLEQASMWSNAAISRNE